MLRYSLYLIFILPILLLSVKNSTLQRDKAIFDLQRVFKTEYKAYKLSNFMQTSYNYNILITELTGKKLLETPKIFLEKNAKFIFYLNNTKNNILKYYLKKDNVILKEGFLTRAS